MSPSCSDDSVANENMVLHMAEERDDDLVNTSATHTTEDLFTIIHRYEYAHTFAAHVSSIMVIIDNDVTADVFSQKVWCNG